MGFETALYAFLHVLVFVYWLGGDLGAFYSSKFLTAKGVSADRRMMAAKIIGDVDMAPRTGLILALPTGLLLALSKGWIAGPIWWGWAGLAAGLVWLALAWKLHLDHGAAKIWKTLDLAIRVILLVSLIGVGVAALLQTVPLPQFIAIKMILLACAIVMGLLIRRVCQPLGPALMGLTGAEAARSEAVVADILKTSRPLVMIIWGLIASAAFLGLWAPPNLF